MGALHGRKQLDTEAGLVLYMFQTWCLIRSLPYDFGREVLSVFWLRIFNPQAIIVHPTPVLLIELLWALEEILYAKKDAVQVQREQASY